MLNPSTTLHPLLVFCASALAVLLPVPGWAQVTPSAVTLVAGDPITPVQFSLAKGSSRTTWGAVFKLPPGLELSPAGLLSGTATGPGNYSQRIATANPSFGQNVTISILPNAPRITSPADRTHLGNAGLRLPSGPFRVSATGGTAPYKWTARISRIDPAPQAGGPNSTVAILPFDSTSADFSGNFSAAGNYTISVQAAGNNNFPQRSAAVFYTIQVGANPPRIVSPAPGTFLGNATVGVPFGPVEVGATGGFAPYSWTLTASGAPASQVQLAPRSGNATFLTANFTAPGNVTVNVVASGANRESSRPAAYTIRVLPLPKPAISPAGGFLANATAGVPYGPVALSALGGMPPYRWSANITSPAADGSSIAIAPSGGGNTSATLTGNFVKAATYGVRVTISDSNPAGSQSASANFQIPSSAPPPAPRVLPIRLPAAILGLPYPGFKFAASGGLAPLAWSCQPSPPAAGLSLSPAGILSGTPIEAPGASYPMAVPFKVSATDSVSRSGSADATLLVVRPLSVSGPSGISGPRYQPIAPAPFNAAGGLGNYTWSTTPRLPSSISIHPSTGLVSGNLSAAVGNYTVAITVADPASGQTASQNVTVTILPPGPFQWSTEPDLPGGKVRSAFTADLVVGGGTPPYTFAVKNGSALPPGLTLNSTTGRLFGTPTIPGAYSFTITARDSAIPSQTIERTFTQAIGAYGLAVGGPSNLAVQQYSTLAPAHYAATGGRPNYTYSTNPTLPAGLSLATTNATAGTATLGGIATAAPGNYTVAVTVRDGANQPASQNVTIAVTPPPPLVWTTESALPGGKVLTPYSTNLTASGGRPPYAYTTKNGSTLPAGLTLNATTGLLAGTPSTAGNHSFTITAKDSAVPAQTIERTFTLSVEPYGMALNGPSNLAVQQYAALAPALYTASGGRPNYSFSTAPALPAGLSLATTNATRGSATMSGNATAAPGNYTVAITVRDGANQPASQNVTITVTPPPPLVWATESALPGGKVLTPYSTNLNASGGRPPYAFTTKNGSTLPAGLNLNPTTGRLAGTPTLAGNHSFTITAKDSAAPANAIERTFTLSVEPYGMDLLLDCPISGKVGQPLSVPFTVVGGQPPHTVSGGALPAGLSVSLANNRISGTPTTAGNFSVAWTLRDGRNQSVTKNCTITIAPADPLAIATPADLGSTSVNATFSAPFQATGGRPPYTWSFASRGNLPANANLTASGNFTAISPMPLAANFTIRVADSAGANATKAMVVQFVGPAFSQMVLVQGGTLPEGSFVANKTVASFLIGRTEVTWAEWKAVRAWAVANGYDLENIGQASGEDHPVGIGGATANWTSAVKWCNAKSEMEGLVPVYTINGEVYRAAGSLEWFDQGTPDASPSANGYRLPREGEWEWAARGGLLSQNYTYSGGNDLDSVAWYLNNSLGNKTSPVGLKVANELGLFDMSGNAEEWCEDLGRGVTRTKKGGSHQGSAAFCRIVSRGPIPSHFTGFRLARNFGPKIHVQSNLLSAAVGRPIIGFIFGVRGALVSPAWSIAGGALPPGIGFNPATATLSGTPTQAGTFHFTVRVEEQGYRDELEFEVAVDSMPRFSEFVPVEGGTLPESAVLANTTVSYFEIGKYEVTWNLWQAVRDWAVQNGYPDLAGKGAGNFYSVEGAYPVNKVTWYDMVKWCNARSEKEGLLPVYSANGTVFRQGHFGSNGSDSVVVDESANGYRLPTQAEWEWAALGGVASKGFVYSGSDNVDEVGWYQENHGGFGSRTVGGKNPNELGIHDMSGNIAEFSEDLRILGGYWGVHEDLSAVSPKNIGETGRSAADSAFFGLGFRLARNIGPKISITGDLPEAVLNQPYAGFTFGVAGTNRPVAWSIPEGALPPGMSFSANGTLGGTPTQIGLYTFVIRVESGGYSDEVEVELEVVSWDLEEGLVGYYQFNGNANDLTEFSNHGSLHGNHVYLPEGGVKIIGDASERTRGGGYFSVPVSGYALSDSVTFHLVLSGVYQTFWAAEPILAWGTESYGTGLMQIGGSMGIGKNSAYSFWHAIYGQLSEVVSANITATVDTVKTTITAVKSKTSMSFYIDGKLVETKINNIPLPGDSFLTIGRHSWVPFGGGTSTRLTANLHTFKVYNRALSSSEVEKLTALEYEGMVLVQGGIVPESSELARQIVPAFHIARFETTWGEWKSVRDWAVANGYDIGTAGQGSADNHPVRDISWYDTVKWCNAKSQMEGLVPVYTVGGSVYKTGSFGASGSGVVFFNALADGYRLPTEAEWEWAALGGASGKGFLYSGSNSVDEVGWYFLNANGAVVDQKNGRGTWPVGRKSPNELGIYDMSGNALEFCWDGVSLPTGLDRRTRGGSWIYEQPDYLQSLFRSSSDADAVREDIGFRYARNAIGDMVPVGGGTLPAGSGLSGQSVAPFEIGKTEVTWDEWKSVRDWAVANGYSDLAGVGEGSAGNHPVRSVNWFDAAKWCNAKSEKEGLDPVYSSGGGAYRTGQSAPSAVGTANGYRLPTEAEWEWAALGGPASRGFTYPGSNNLDEVAWHWGNSMGSANDYHEGRGTWPAGLKLPNELGIHDMAGNVEEWCWDFDFPGYRAYRGRSNATLPEFCPTLRRNPSPGQTPGSRNPHIGFRIARNGQNPSFSLAGTFQALAADGMSIRLFGKGFQHLKSIELLQSSRFYGIAPSAIHPDAIDFAVPPDSGAAFLGYSVLILEGDRGELAVAHPAFDYTAPQRISSPVDWTLGGSTLIIEEGGEVRIDGSGSGTFFVLSGGKLSGFGGGGSNRVWLEKGGEFQTAGGGGGGNEVAAVESISFALLQPLP
jgi:formylglycine-generating enzyme required for sulfatase activity